LAMPDVEKAVEKYNLDDYYQRALNLIISGRARKAFDLTQEPEKVRDRYGRNTFGQSCLLARRLIEAGTRVVEVIWPKIANSDNTGSSPAADPVHPTELLATIYHAFGIDPDTIVYNHLKQPRELVKAKAVTTLFA